MRRLALTCCVAVLGGTAGAGAASSPASLCVGKGSHCFAVLGAALAAAHDGGTIRIGPGTFTGGISIVKSVTLVGAGAKATTIRGGGPVITIGRRGAARGPKVSIRGVTITGGVTTSDPAGTCGPDIPTCGAAYPRATALAGGIEVLPAGAAARVSIVDSVVSGNRAAPAITVPSVQATCPGGPCTFAQAAGGGIDNWGTLTLKNTTVSGNVAGGAVVAQADGGGIVDEAGAHVTLDHSTVSGNRAVAPAPNGRFADGGGIYVDQGGVLVVRHSSISGNSSTLSSTYPKSVTDSHASTAGIFVADHGSATIDATRIDGNTVRVTDPNGEPVGYDPAICVCDQATSLVLRNSVVSGNRLIVRVADSGDGGSGGGLEFDGAATISDTRITRNSVDVTATAGLAAAVAIVNTFDNNSEPAVIADSTITNNTVKATSAKGSVSIDGVGLANNGPLVLRNVTISDNSGSASGSSGTVFGGGIFNGKVFPTPSPTLALQNSKLTHNKLTASAGVTVQGGGLYTKGYPATLGKSQIAGNSPDQCFGC